LISFRYHRIRATELQVKALGMKIEIFDPAGNNIEKTGQAGELVCTRPHPSLPSKFWGDDAVGTKFLKAYYDMYPGVLDPCNTHLPAAETKFRGVAARRLHRVQSTY